MSIFSQSIPAMILNYAAGLRFRTLALLIGTLFVLDVLVPDAIPFVDEILLGLATLLFGSLRKKEKRGSGRNQSG